MRQGKGDHEIWYSSITNRRFPVDAIVKIPAHGQRGFEAGGIVKLDTPRDWSSQAHVALSCAMYCVAWEHLRNVSGLRAQELVQSAEMHLHREFSS